MKKLFLYFSIVILTVGRLAAHTVGDFYEHCDKIGLPDCTFNWKALTSTDTALYLVGDKGMLFIYYFNGGVTSVKTGVTENLTGVQFLNTSIGYIWGNNGTLLKTINGGLTWLPINTGIVSTIKKVQFTDENTGYMMADNAIQKTTDGGTVWTLVSLPASILWQDFHFFDASNGQICGYTGQTGYIHTTSSGGAAWAQLYTDAIAFSQLNYSTGTVGFVYGETSNNPLALKTTNTGIAWNIEYTKAGWTLGSDMVTYRNATHFISNDVLGKFLYGSVLFLSNPDGIVTSGINIHVAHQNGEEVLYIVSASGLYRYFVGETICTNLRFSTGLVNENETNPYNVMDTSRLIRCIPLSYNATIDTVKSVSCKLTCRSPYITITDSLSSHTNILPFSASNGVGEFEILVHNDIPNGYVVHFEIEYYNKIPLKQVSKSIFDLPIILSPIIIHHTYVWDTTTDNYTANGNGVLEPTETASIVPMARNTSIHDFYNIKGTLYSPYNQINIFNNIANPEGDNVQYNNYSYGSLSPFVSSVQPVGSYALTNNFDSLYKIPLTMIFSGQINSFKDANGCYYTEYFSINYNWATTFYLNDGATPAPDSLLPTYHPFVPLPPDTTPNSVNITTNLNVYSVYPNPSDGNFDIQATSMIDWNNANIELYSMYGTQLMPKYKVLNSSTLHVDIADFVEGTYFLRFRTATDNKVLKIVKTNN
jgi:Secretion system C-terminal sorting domain/Photosynthesis system II assembly factor YCF48